MTNSTLPSVADADSCLSEKELEVLRKQFIREGEYVTDQTRFNYAWGLIKSKNRSDQTRGVLLLTDIYREVPDRRRECLFYLAVGHFKLGSYNDARKFNDSLLEFEPSNSQALALRQEIEDRVAKEGLVGMAIVGAVVAVGTIVLTALVKKK
ncbi:mitochondrial membrane protein [Actinomortierella ambigua]|uniref:Mitochondrial fission 1 protein n=1 Tax=Actinomortierella ambigua TaxID=1343610 RepID=A0A9P6PZX9_9FUNG|nr:mitochondrial membrane protein [Actinomortierella ambigua]KAG0255644.1 mitochondrial membrane protein [Actinomortierella ambigua]